MKILITGSSGMLGTGLCGILKKDYHVVGIDIIAPQTDDHRPQAFYNAGITDKKEIEKIFEEEKPEVVIHAAAWTDVDGCEKDPDKAHSVNDKGVLSVAEAAEKNNSKLIFISTDFVFDGESTVPYKETDSTGPVSVYGKSKLAGEAQVMKVSGDFVIIRTSWLFGKFGRNFVDTIIRKAEHGERLDVVDDQKGSPTYVPDLSLALKTAIEARVSREIYHFSNDGECTWFGFASCILSLMNMDMSILHPATGSEISRPAPRPSYSVLNTGKIKKDLGVEIRSWQEALEEYIKTMKTEKT